jgi:hypothetical protein
MKEGKEEEKRGKQQHQKSNIKSNRGGKHYGPYTS